MRSLKSRLGGRATQLALISLVFALVAIAANPFFYDADNSGRYLVPVIRYSGEGLYPGDAVVDSLERFDSLFYQLLKLGHRITDYPPESLETILFVLYLCSRLLLSIIACSFAANLSSDMVFVFVWMLLISFQQNAFLGGEVLFAPRLRHIEITVMLALVAILLRVRQRIFAAWVVVGFSILVHSLMAVHLAFILVVADLFKLRRLSRQTVIGLGATGLFGLLYLASMAPAPFERSQAEVFLEAKGHSIHISLLDQPPIEWAMALIYMALSLLAYSRYLKSDKNARAFVRYAVIGTAAGIFLSILTLSIDDSLLASTLARLQPMRMFYWVTFFCLSLLALAVPKALRHEPVSGGLILLSVLSRVAYLESRLPLVFASISLADLAISHVFLVKGSRYRRHWQAAVKSGVIALAVVLVVAWAYEKIVPIHVTLSHIILVLSTLILMEESDIRLKPALFSLPIAIAIVAGSANRHAVYPNPIDWYAVQYWAREHTQQDEVFLTTGGANFRTRSFRITLTEDMSALAWVDVNEYLRNQELVERVQRGRTVEGWDLGYLFSLAKAWNVSYVVADGSCDAHQFHPVFVAGNYCVFAIP